MPLRQAWERMENITPLRQDCGALCAAACCQDEDGEELGMLLFPGEEKLYTDQDASWMKIVEAAASFKGNPLPLLVCKGSCPRERRPLACRIFPLSPGIKGGNVVPRMDARARHICPLYASGIEGLAPGFLEAVSETFSILWQDAAQREYLLWTRKLVDEHARMMRLWGTRI